MASYVNYREREYQTNARRNEKPYSIAHEQLARRYSLLHEIGNLFVHDFGGRVRDDNVKAIVGIAASLFGFLV